jgi:DNA-binding GntR family transcriptional regulator
MLEPVGTRPSSLTEIAFDRIRDAITSNSLAPGTRVSESMLSELLHVSKTPVREALLRLCHIGLVEPTTRGLRVVMPNPDIIRDAYELRSGLESVAAQTASVRADDKQRHAILDAGKRSLERAKAGDSTGFAEWDISFHNIVADATGNKLLAKAIGESLVLAFTLRSRDVPTINDSVHCGQEHVDIAKTIASGKGAEAAAQMAQHITGVMQLMLETGLRAS